MKMHYMSKFHWSITNSVCEKTWFKTNGPSKVLFYNFCLFSLSRFQTTIVKNLIMDFNGSFYVTNIFDLQIFDNETTAL